MLCTISNSLSSLRLTCVGMYLRVKFFKKSREHETYVVSNFYKMVKPVKKFWEQILEILSQLACRRYLCYGSSVCVLEKGLSHQQLNLETLVFVVLLHFDARFHFLSQWLLEYAELNTKTYFSNQFRILNLILQILTKCQHRFGGLPRRSHQSSSDNIKMFLKFETVVWVNVRSVFSFARLVQKQKPTPNSKSHTAVRKYVSSKRCSKLLQ